MQTAYDRHASVLARPQLLIPVTCFKSHWNQEHENKVFLTYKLPVQCPHWMVGAELRGKKEKVSSLKGLGLLKEEDSMEGVRPSERVTGGSLLAGVGPHGASCFYSLLECQGLGFSFKEKETLTEK